MTPPASPSSASAAGESPVVFLGDWPSALIQAVAAVSPDTLRDDPMAVRPGRMVDNAYELATVSLDEEHLAFCDMVAFAHHLEQTSYQRVVVEGETWWVDLPEGPLPARAPGSAPAPVEPKSIMMTRKVEWPEWTAVMETPITDQRIIDQTAFSDCLVAAVGVAYPDVYRDRDVDNGSWAVHEADVDVFCWNWGVEGFICDDDLVPLFDFPAYVAHVMATRFVAVDTPEGRYYLHRVSDDRYRPQPTGKPNWEDVLDLELMSDRQMAAATAQLPALFREEEREMVFITDQLERLLDRWSENQQLHREAWHEPRLATAELQVWRAETRTCFLPFTVGDQQWWGYLPAPVDPEALRAKRDATVSVAPAS